MQMQTHDQWGVAETADAEAADVEAADIEADAEAAGAKLELEASDGHQGISFHCS